MSDRPAIAVTLAVDTSVAGRYALRQDYIRSVEKARALPIVLAPTHPEAASDLLAHVQGLLLTGGSDVDPELYAEEAHPTVQAFRERDDFEIALCREALRRDLPVLAICRGQQVLNVAMGGTLVQDIPSQLGGATNHDPAVERAVVAHDVRVLPGTRLREILGRETVGVNSFHHQAVKELGRGLRVGAESLDDGVIEAVEDPSRRFLLGVQWHPEAFWRESTFDGLFRALVEAAKRS